ncbi:MAG: flagellar motor protein MotA [Planctomycetaceae bacterium]|nr:MAG: flagellar motor protein MotA [Planctomycetaceae bacterium]
MIVFVASLIVIGSVLGGFTMAGGHVGALIHPSEIVTIGGAALGALVMMSPKKVLVDLAKGVLTVVKGSPYNRKAYIDLFKMSYELLRLARRDGLLALEPHLNDPHSSKIFEKYPRLAKNHHVLEFLCDGFAPVIEGSADAEQIRHLMEQELHVIESEHHAAVAALQKTADALPGFGIVAAVLGIVITMGAIDGPVHEIGHKVGAALVGTFLGILMSYGFFAPLAGRMEFLGEAELGFFRTMAAIIQAAVHDATPKVALEQARRGVGTEFRPSRQEMEQLFKEVDAQS